MPLYYVRNVTSCGERNVTAVQGCKVRTDTTCVEIERRENTRSMDDLDTALLIYLEDEASEDERLEESELFKCRSTEGAFSILVARRLHCNEEKFREFIRI